MRFLFLGPLAILSVGVALVITSVLAGGASVSLLVVFPIVSGSSLAFVLGVVFLIVGFLSFPLTLGEGWERVPAQPSTASGNSKNAESSAGGFVLVGPVPIVFGSWKGISRRTRWWMALSGGVLLAVVLLTLALWWT
jgi:uncharacterized protein (TIGR00304 family)